MNVVPLRTYIMCMVWFGYCVVAATHVRSVSCVFTRHYTLSTASEDPWTMNVAQCVSLVGYCSGELKKKYGV